MRTPFDFYQTPRWVDIQKTRLYHLIIWKCWPFGILAEIRYIFFQMLSWFLNAHVHLFTLAENAIPG